MSSVVYRFIQKLAAWPLTLLDTSERYFEVTHNWSAYHETSRCMRYSPFSSKVMKRFISWAYCV